MMDYKYPDPDHPFDSNHIKNALKGVAHLKIVNTFTSFPVVVNDRS